MFGQSRSASMVCAYLIQKNKMKLETVLYQIKQKRPSVQPNPGFMN